MVPACGSDTVTKVLPNRDVRLQTQGMTPIRVTVCRHGTNLSCYPLMWNITVESTTTNFHILGLTRPGNPSPAFQTGSGWHRVQMDFYTIN